MRVVYYIFSVGLSLILAVPGILSFYLISLTNSDLITNLLINQKYEAGWD